MHHQRGVIHRDPKRRVFGDFFVLYTALVAESTASIPRYYISLAVTALEQSMLS